MQFRSTVGFRLSIDSQIGYSLRVPCRQRPSVAGPRAGPGSASLVGGRSRSRLPAHSQHPRGSRTGVCFAGGAAAQRGQHTPCHVTCASCLGFSGWCPRACGSESKWRQLETVHCAALQFCECMPALRLGPPPLRDCSLSPWAAARQADLVNPYPLQG